MSETEDSRSPSAPPVKPGARRGSPIRIVAVSLALGGAAMLIGAQLGGAIKRAGGEGPSLDVWEKVVLVGGCFVVALLVLLLHELGHLIGGYLVGFRAFLLIVGPVRLERRGNAWSVFVNRDLALAGGLAGSAPTDGLNLARRTAIMVAGGPFVSLAVGVMATIVLATLDFYPFAQHDSLARSMLAVGLLMVAGVSTAIGVVTLVPLTTSGYLSDGARLLRLLRGGPDAARDSAIHAIVGASLSGVRPRDWRPDLLRVASSQSDGSAFEFTAWQLAQAHAADSGKAEEALQRLRSLLPHVGRMPVSLTTAIHLDAARQFALADAVGEAREQLALATGTAFAGPYLQPFAAAVLLAHEGRYAEADALVPQVRAQLALSIDRGVALWLLDSLDAFERQRLP